MGWLTRVLLFALLALMVVRSLRRFMAGVAQGMGHGPRARGQVDSGVKMFRDPICGTYVLPGSALAVRDEQGMHYFCSQKCREAFLATARRSSHR
jgi:YHS domain-containing protein